MADDGGGTILQSQTEGEVHILVMRIIPGGWVPGGAPPDPARIWVRTLVGVHPAAGVPADVICLVSMDDRSGGIPS